MPKTNRGNRNPSRAAVAAALEELRGKLDISQAEFARKYMQTTPMKYSYFLHGAADPNICELYTLRRRGVDLIHRILRMEGGDEKTP